MILSRRAWLGALPIVAGSAAIGRMAPQLRLSGFHVEITCPIGHPCMGGGISPAKRIVDPLYAHGLVFHGEPLGQPVVWLALDWCEIRNGAYEAWRSEVARAVRTEPSRVMLCCLHQHDAPIADVEAQELLTLHKAVGQICDLKFLRESAARVARATRESLTISQPITHLGLGKANVQDVASNRRYRNAQGMIRHDRGSATRDSAIRATEVGTIDPELKSLSFWNGDRPLAVISAYATHPMSYYGRGEVSADFVGLARKLCQANRPQVQQIYVSGCSGNVTAGKFNDGSPDNRPVLARRLVEAMDRSWEQTRRVPVSQVLFRQVPLKLPARSGPAFAEEALLNMLKTDPKPFQQCLAALGLSWRKRVQAERPIDLVALDFGEAVLSLLPAESYVEYQLAAQAMRPKSFVLVAGYGECGPGYIPTEQAWKEQDSNLRDWCWVDTGSEPIYLSALKKLLTP